MTSSARAVPCPPQPARPQHAPKEAQARPCEKRPAYDRSFWLAYASNVLLTLAMALLFRYADFITLLGGSEWHLGWIVGVGMVGSLAMRLTMGSCIDRYGSRIVWLGSIVLFAAACFAHLAITSCSGPAVYLFRILYCSAIAGIFGASMTFISQQVSVKRMAEFYGMLGTATFVGYLLGSQLSDVLFGSAAVDRAATDQMFWIAGAVALLALLPTWLATRKEVRPQPAHGPSSWQLLRKHQPGVLLAVALMGGMVFQMPNAFLRAYTAELNIPRIGLFFTICAAAAVLIRVPTRRWPERFGNRAIILVGVSLMVVSQLAFLPVRTEWQLAVPALLFGCSQAILSPAMMAAGSVAFPARYRGLATTLVQAAGDVGLLVGSPMAGIIVNYSDAVSLPPYPVLFVTMAGLLAGAGVWYAISSRRSAKAA
jgi:MFS family permease